MLPRQGDIIWSSWVERDGDTLIASSFPFGQLQWIDLRSGRALKTREGFANPYAILRLPDERLLIAEYGSGRILAIDAPYDGEPAVFAGGLDGPLGLAIDGDRLFVTEARGGRVTMLSLAGSARREVAAGLNQPEGIALLPDGRLAIAEAGARRLVALDIDTADIHELATDLPIGLPPFMGPPETFLPTGVAVDSQGNILVTADVGHTVLKLTPVN